jgi:hypothetical protein
MCISWAFTGDGLLAFAGGALALIGVWWSNRQSIKNLEKQLEAERKARTEETERQGRAVATAIAFEIDFIYRGYVRDAEALFKEVGPHTNFGRDLLGKRVEEFPFTVYEGCAPLLGALPPTLVQGIVRLYGEIAVYLTTTNELYAALQRAQSASLGDHRLVEVEVWVQQVRTQATIVRVSAAEVLGVLCEFAGIPKSRMAVLADTQGSDAQKN